LESFGVKSDADKAAEAFQARLAFLPGAVEGVDFGNSGGLGEAGMVVVEVVVNGLELRFNPGFVEGADFKFVFEKG
jgi:hypothetical protein